MIPVKPIPVVLRRRIVAVLHQAAPTPLTTRELSARVGLSPDHDPYLRHQLRSLARAGIILRTHELSGTPATWQLNPAAPDPITLNALLQPPKAAPTPPPEFKHANTQRAQQAAHRTAQDAQRALAIYQNAAPNLQLPPKVQRQQWIEVLRLRATNDNASLRELAAQMTPPMTKDAYAGRLKRACWLAEEIATHHLRDSEK